MGILFSRRRREVDDAELLRQMQIVGERQRRRRAGLALASYRLLRAPGHLFHSVTDLLRVLVATQRVWLKIIPSLENFTYVVTNGSRCCCFA